MSNIKVKALTHIYSQGTPFEKAAIKNIDIDIPHGQFVGVIGHTGSGKSTFIQHLNGLLKPTSGNVFLDGTDIHSSKRSLKEARFNVGLVFQYPEYQLFEETVYKDIAFGPKNMGLGDEEIDHRVHEAAGFAGVPEDILTKSPLELSGGQKRRVAIAGVIAMRPGVLVLDEPTAGLDPLGRESILENICSYHKATGSTIILVSHDMDNISRLAQRILVFNDARLAMDGSPEEIFSHAEMLTSMGLAIPSTAAIAMRLRQLGVDIPQNVYSIDKLSDAILSLWKEGQPC